MLNWMTFISDQEITMTTKVSMAGAVRTASIELFGNFDPSVWSNQGVANEVIFSVRAIAFIIAGHEAHHLKVIRSKYLGA